MELQLRKTEKQAQKEAATVNAQILADISKMNIDQRFTVVETRLKILESRLK
jgi:hypothetical protein